MCCEKYVNIYFGLYSKSTVRSVRKNPELSNFCSSYGMIYIDIRNIKVLFNNFITHINSNFLLYPHPSY